MFAMIGPRPAPTDSWWLRHLPSDAMPAAVAVPDSADTVIVGAGMTGCATAYWLQKLFQKGGADVVVLDARGCAGGATGRNGGHLWSNPASTFEQATVAELLSFIEEANVDCDLTRDGATALDRREPEVDVTYNDGEMDPENHEDEDWGDKFVEWSTAECEARLQTDAVRCHAWIEMLSARPFPPSHHTFSRALTLKCRWILPPHPRPQFERGYHFDGACQFYPAKVTAALLRKAECTYCAPVRVTSIEAEDHSGGWQLLQWAGGAGDDEAAPRGVLRARRVVVAANGWAAELLPELKPHLYATRNTVIMTKPLPRAADWGVGAFSVDSDNGARELYAIRRPDGRVCLGGARALEPDAAVGNSDDSSNSETVGRYLRTFLAKRFPRLLEEATSATEGEGVVEAEWSGILGFTTDGKPLVGALPGRPNVLVGAGFCGHGMPQCFGVGKGLALMLEGSAEQQAEQVHPFLRTQANVARFLQ